MNSYKTIEKNRKFKAKLFLKPQINNTYIDSSNTCKWTQCTSALPTFSLSLFPPSKSKGWTHKASSESLALLDSAAMIRGMLIGCEYQPVNQHRHRPIPGQSTLPSPPMGCVVHKGPNYTNGIVYTWTSRRFCRQRHLAFSRQNAHDIIILCLVRVLLNLLLPGTLPSGQSFMIPG